MNEKPVKIEKEWECEGFKCKVIFVRNSHRCGYIGIPKGHVAYNKNYDDLPIEVHGGLTYSDMEKDGLNWFGFDCIHAGDKSASPHIPSWQRDAHFWTLEETVKETEKMAKQFKDLTLKAIIEEKLRYEPDWLKNSLVIKEEAS